MKTFTSLQTSLCSVMCYYNTVFSIVMYLIFIPLQSNLSCSFVSSSLRKKPLPDVHEQARNQTH